MPNFKKSDGFSLGGNPFTMKKGSKEITTDGSFRKEATDKMGGYGSPLFAIKSSVSETDLYDAPADQGRSGMAEAVDEGMKDGEKLGAALEGDGGEDSDTSMDDSAKESTISGATEQKLVDPEVMEEEIDDIVI